MTTALPTEPDQTDRSLRLYRTLLALYPRSFRAEYGEDMVQAFGDLLVFSTNRRATWMRTGRDLLASATRQRITDLGGVRPPSFPVLVAIAAGIVALVIQGPQGFTSLAAPIILLPSVLIGLPVYGLTRVRQAVVVRRTTGGPVARLVVGGIATLLPGAAALVVLGDDAGYFIFISVALGLIVGSAIGIVWGVATLVTGWNVPGRGRRRPVLILIPCLAVLSLIIGGSYNSYRQSLGPAGDHSVANASADTRALWEAANAGDIDAVERLTTTTCADPWVKFPVGNGRHNAKGQAEANMLEVTDELDVPLGQVADVLGDYMDVWHERCN